MDLPERDGARPSTPPQGSAGAVSSSLSSARTPTQRSVPEVVIYVSPHGGSSRHAAGVRPAQPGPSSSSSSSRSGSAHVPLSASTPLSSGLSSPPDSSAPSGAAASQSLKRSRSGVSPTPARLSAGDLAARFRAKAQQRELAKKKQNGSSGPTPGRTRRTAAAAAAALASDSDEELPDLDMSMLEAPSSSAAAAALAARRSHSPSASPDTGFGVRAKRSTAKADAYNFKLALVRPSQRRIDNARIKESAAVQAGLVEARTLKTKPVDEDAAEMRRMLAQKRRLRERGVGDASELDELLRQTRAEFARADERGDESDARSAVSAASRSGSSDSEEERMERALLAAQSDGEMQTDVQGGTGRAQAQAAMAIIKKSKSRTREQTATEQFRFWTSDAAAIGPPPCPALDPNNALDARLSAAAKLPNRLAAILRSGILRQRGRFHQAPASPESSRRGSDSSQLLADEERAPVVLASWLFQLAVHSADAALAASACAALRDILAADAELLAGEAPSPSPETQTSLAVLALLSSVPASLTALGASRDVLALCLECSPSDIKDAPSPVGTRGAERPQAVKQLLDVLELIIELPTSVLLDPEVTTARHDAAVALLCMQADVAEAHAFSLRLPQLLPVLLKPRALRAGERALAGEAALCAKLEQVLAVSDVQTCLRLVRALPDVQPRARIVRAWSAWSCLLRGAESAEPLSSPVLPLESLLRLGRASPLLVHAAAQGSAAGADGDEDDYAALRERICLLELALADLPLQLCLWDEELQDDDDDEAERTPPRTVFLAALEPFKAALASAHGELRPCASRVELVEQLVAALREANAAIVDGRGAFLARSQTKDAMQRLELSLRYRLNAAVGQEVDARRSQQARLSDMWAPAA